MSPVSAKKIVELIKATRTPIAFGTLTLILCASIVTISDYKLVGVLVIVIYSAFALWLFNKVQKDHHDQSFPRTYNSIHAAFPIMNNLIEASIAAGGNTSIQVIGLSLHHMWDFVRKYLDDDSCKNITIDLALISGAGNQESCLQNNWKSLAYTHYKSIIQYQEDHYQELHLKNNEIHIFKYNHIPMFHGVLINDQYLFFSFVSWDTGKQTIAKEANFYFYCDSNDGPGRIFIDIFRSWRNHIKTVHDDKS